MLTASPLPATSPAAPATATIARPGGAVAYDVAGEGPLVVCVPGMGDLRSTYRHLSPLLVAAGHRVATADLRGHGESDATFDAYGDEATADDALALAEHLGGPAVLVGSSMGAAAAVIAAVRRPDLVRGVVLLGPFVRDHRVPLHQRLLMQALLVRPWGPAAATAWMRSLSPARRAPDADAHLRAVRAALRRPGAWRAFRRTAFSGHAESGRLLASLDRPALVVMGSRDPDFPDPRREADEIAAAVGGTSVLVDGAGHYPQAEAAEDVAAAIVPFLAGLPRA